MTTVLATLVLGISGSYFESRTCAIFAGPCHFSGEVMVDGSTALIAWKFEGGQIGGLQLKGLAAAAVVQAERNFAFDSRRKSMVLLPPTLTLDQRTEMLALLSTQIDLGSVLKVAAATVRLTNDSVSVTSAAPIFAARTTQRECSVCSMPGELWYEPLSRGTTTHVATIEEQALFDATLGETWVRKEEPSAFVGRFSW